MKALFKSRYAVSIVHKTCYLSEKEISLVQHDLFLANLSWPLLIISLFPIHKRKLCLIICFNIFPAIQVRLFSPPIFLKLLFFFFLKMGIAIPCHQSSFPRCCGKGFLMTLGLLQPDSHLPSVSFCLVWLAGK